MNIVPDADLDRFLANRQRPGKGKGTTRVTIRRRRFKRVLQGLTPILRIPDWRLTTAEVLYHMPDHPHVLQTFVWQKLDRAPEFPELSRFLEFWRREIEAPLHSVRVASAALARIADLRYANGVFALH